MIELDLPPAPPLLAEVRERALHTVLVGAPPPCRVASLAAAVAGVGTTLAVTMSVVLTSNVASINALARMIPTPSPDVITAREDRIVLAACRTLARYPEFEARGLPPDDEWSVTDVLGRGGGADADETAFAINDSFVCTGTRTVYLSDDQGTSVGDAEVTGLSRGLTSPDLRPDFATSNA